MGEEERESENDGGWPLFGFLSSLTLYSYLGMSEESQKETWPHFTSKAILLSVLSANRFTLNQALTAVCDSTKSLVVANVAWFYVSFIETLHLVILYLLNTVL